ncbi:MAG: 1-acyl-sn-glycerol-3-phosphate acyltransferase [Phycisphaera sp.]|nr:1-acyl-sn-glycerol-3-phosphate acyltransferase [Phycisphaera sp.]
MDKWRYEPARDLGLDPTERWRSPNREAGLIAATAQFTAISVIKSYLAIYHRYTIHGRDNLPDAPSYILAANHTSHLDALCLSVAVPAARRTDVTPIAAGDLFFRTPPRAFLSALTLNALPMWRASCGRHALQELRDRLQSRPTIFIFFPEGTRSRTGDLNRFKAGIGMLVAESKIPVVPCHLEGCHRALPPDRSVPRPRHVSLTIGAPLTFSGTPNNRTGWNAIANQVCDAVVNLAPTRPAE